MKVLEAVLEHRTIDFIEDVVPNLYLVIGRDTQDPDVIRSVVNLAQAESVGDDWLAVLTVGDDVGGV